MHCKLSLLNYELVEEMSVDINEMKANGNACMTKKDYTGAVEWYSKGIQADPNNYILFSNRSAAYLSDGKAKEALVDAEQCIKLNPTWPKGYCRKGAALQALSKYDEAVSIFEEGRCFPTRF